MSPIKEPNYFAPEIRLENFSERLRPRAEQDARKLRAYLDGPMREKRFGGVVTEWQDYLKLFQQADGQKAVGEASVCYLWSETGAARIRERIPNARIILILRNPVDVAFSLYLHGLRSGAPNCTFREAIQMGLEQRGGPIDVMHPFLDLGLYCEQIRRFMAIFPAAQLSIHFYEDYENDPARVLAELFRFLDVDPAFQPDMSKRYLESPKPGIPLDPDDRAYLREFYKEDILQLSRLLNRDLAAWLAV